MNINSEKISIFTVKPMSEFFTLKSGLKATIKGILMEPMSSTIQFTK